MAEKAKVQTIKASNGIEYSLNGKFHATDTACGHSLTKARVLKIIGNPTGNISLKCSCGVIDDLEVSSKRGGIQIGCQFFTARKVAVIRAWAER